MIFIVIKKKDYYSSKKLFGFNVFLHFLFLIVTENEKLFKILKIRRKKSFQVKNRSPEVENIAFQWKRLQISEEKKLTVDVCRD